MTGSDELRERVRAGVETLPEPGLREIAAFLDYLEYKFRLRSPVDPPYRPMALGGLWSGITIRDEDIAEVRHEMWKGFGEQEP